MAIGAATSGLSYPATARGGGGGGGASRTGGGGEDDVRRSLSCISPDGRTVFSLDVDSGSSGSSSRRDPASGMTPSSSSPSSSPRRCSIVVTPLPLGERDGGGGNAAAVGEARAELPSGVASALEVDPPLGLIFADNRNLDSSTYRSYRSSSPGFASPPPGLGPRRGPGGGGNKNGGKNKNRGGGGVVMLALYTRASVWLVEVGRGSGPHRGRDDPSAENRYPGERDAGESERRQDRNDGDDRESLHVRNVEEPFEGYLLSTPPGTVIVRVRPAPSDVLAPPGSLAMLLSDGSLVLHHGRGGGGGSSGGGYGDLDGTDRITTPLSSTNVSSVAGAAGELEDLDSSRVIDFCFGVDDDDSGASLGELSVAVLFRNGDVYGACPIAFDRAACPRRVVESRIGFLEGELEKIPTPAAPPLAGSGAAPVGAVVGGGTSSLDGARWRQFRAAKQWMVDAFDVTEGCENEDIISHGGSHNDRPYFASTRLTWHGTSSSNATHWPVELQGPLVYGRTDDGTVEGNACGPALAIEALRTPRSRSACPGVTVWAVARAGDQVDLCTFARPLCPRFAFESDEDAAALNENTVGSGAVLDGVVFDQKTDRSEEEGAGGPSDQYDVGGGVGRGGLFVEIISDQVSPALSHVASDAGIFTVSFGVIEQLEVMARRGDKEKHTTTGYEAVNVDLVGGRKKTTAWSCFAVGAGVGISGMVVSGDPQLGHVLIGRLSSGIMEAVNVTAAQYLSQAHSLAEVDLSAKLSKNRALATSAEAVKALDSIPPFLDVATPLMKKVGQGLSSTGKLVGSSTKVKDADGTTVATVIAMKRALESGVALPLRELCQHSENRKKILRKVYQSQREQIASLQKMTDEMKERLELTKKRKEVVEENARVLTQRSATVLVASRELLPTITEQEHEYFQQLRRWERQCEQWEDKLVEVQNSATIVCDLLQPTTTVKVQLNEQLSDTCHALLAGQGALLEKSKERLSNLESTVEEMCGGSKRADVNTTADGGENA